MRSHQCVSCNSCSRLSLVLPAVCFLTTWGVVSPVLGSITNGGFESGNFSSWNRSGFLKTGGIPSSLPRNYQTFQAAIGSSPSATENNGVEASQVAAFANGTAGTSPISPTEGNFMAFVSNITSAGNIAVLTGSAISQSFVVPVGGKALTFDVRMLNIDSVSGLSQYDDFAGVAADPGQHNLEPVQYQSRLGGRR